MQKKDIDAAKANVSAVLVDKYSVTGRTLDQQLRKARKHLPKSATREVEFLIDAGHKIKHPVLRKQVDAKQIEAISRNFDQRSGKFDKEKERSKARYYWASNLLLSLLASGGVFYAVLVWLDVV